MEDPPDQPRVACEWPRSVGTPAARIRVAARILSFALGLSFFLVFREQLPAALGAFAKASPIAFLSLGLFLVWNQLATLAWRSLLRATGVDRRSLGELVRLRIESQAVNQLVPSAGVAGEALRTARAGERDELGHAAVATVLDNAAGTLAGLVFAVGAVALHARSRAGAELSALGWSSAAALILLAAAVALPFKLAPRFQSQLGPASRLGKLLEPFTQRGPEVRRAFRVAVGLRFLERVVGAAEVYVLFRAVGAAISPADAALLSAAFVLVSFTVFFVPGQLGAAEAAATATGVLLGVPAALGLSAALLRRARQLLVCLLGVISLLARGLGRDRRPLATEDVA